MLPTKFYADRLLLPWQRNLTQKGYNSDSVRDIFKIFADNGRFWGTGYWMRPTYFHHNRLLLPFECHVIPNSQNRDCKISVVRYLCNWLHVGKRYFINKTANINVQNISLYTCYRQHLRTCTSKTTKTTKGDIIQQHIDAQSVWCGQYHLL